MRSSSAAETWSDELDSVVDSLVQVRFVPRAPHERARARANVQMHIAVVLPQRSSALCICLQASGWSGSPESGELFYRSWAQWKRYPLSSPASGVHVLCISPSVVGP